METLNILGYLSLLIISAITTYIIGFSVGRKSAYKDVKANYPLPTKLERNKTTKWKSNSNELVGAKLAK